MINIKQLEKQSFVRNKSHCRFVQCLYKNTKGCISFNQPFSTSCSFNNLKDGLMVWLNLLINKIMIQDLCVSASFIVLMKPSFFCNSIPFTVQNFKTYFIPELPSCEQKYIRSSSLQKISQMSLVRLSRCWTQV